ncbi:MAG: hypothetical protein J6P94_05810 [Oscillospiraceae bacterium]|nr:hypothetical protein [Oscillospiraceae bacterium]
MKKKILKFIRKCFDSTLAKIILYLILIFVIFFFFGVFDTIGNSISEMFRRMFAIFTSEDTLSVFLAGIFSFFVAVIVKQFDSYLEESSKISDNHHKVISSYSAHSKTDKSEILKTNNNFCDKDGGFMALHSEHITVFGESELKNDVKDKYSKEYKVVQKDLEAFNSGKGKLYLPSLNVFSNICGNTRIIFNDSNENHQLPDFVMQNALKLLSAHKSSNRSNNGTVRLNDFFFNPRENILTLETQRSMYFHMLMTNRCMDYEFDEGLTIRKIYEYRDRISPLNKSVFGNQIGVNGLILTSDGYALVEKRDQKKTTWKNKFAQSISLALKVPDLKLGNNETIKPTPFDANKQFKHIIEKTVKDNFGLTPDDYYKFSLEDNFLGIARDLLEGGKPNMYFYLTTKLDAKQLKELLEKNAARTKEENGLKPLQTSKLSTNYYLIPYNDIRVNFNYSMKVDRRTSYWIRRRVRPRDSRIHAFNEKLHHTLGTTFNPILKRECGEALLVTVAFLELCKERIDAIKNK